MRFWLLASSALLIAACEGEVTGGGTGSDTDFEELEEENQGSDGMTEAEEEAAASGIYSGDQRVMGEGDRNRLGDYPDQGEEMVRNPLDIGPEEPGGKDLPLEKEVEAMNEGDDPIVVTDPEEDGPDR